LLAGVTVDFFAAGAFGATAFVAALGAVPPRWLADLAATAARGALAGLLLRAAPEGLALVVRLGFAVAPRAGFAVPVAARAGRAAVLFPVEDLPAADRLVADFPATDLPAADFDVPGRLAVERSLAERLALERAAPDFSAPDLLAAALRAARGTAAGSRAGAAEAARGAAFRAGALAAGFAVRRVAALPGIRAAAGLRRGLLSSGVLGVRAMRRPLSLF
jgi:hypothetical protein